MNYLHSHLGSYFRRIATGILGLLLILTSVACEVTEEAPLNSGESGSENNEGAPSISQSSSGSNVLAADFTIISEEQIRPPNQRIRQVLRVQMDPNQSDEAKALGIADAVREAESRFSGATVFIVFASSTSTVDGFADVGRGYMSSDGQGMAGDGRGLITDDEEGVIQVEVGSDTYFYEM